MLESTRDEDALKPAYIFLPKWAALFFLVGGILLLIIGVSVRFLFGFSAASDQVFAIEALVSGVATDFLLRQYAHRRLMVAPKVEIPFIYLWSLLCLYVFIARPFE